MDAINIAYNRRWNRTRRKHIVTYQSFILSHTISVRDVRPFFLFFFWFSVTTLGYRFEYYENIFCLCSRIIPQCLALVDDECDTFTDRTKKVFFALFDFGLDYFCFFYSVSSFRLFHIKICPNLFVRLSLFFWQLARI